MEDASTFKEICLLLSNRVISPSSIFKKRAEIFMPAKLFKGEKMKAIIGLAIFSLLTGCAALSPAPMTPYNDVYLNTQLMENQKPYVIDAGGEKIIVEPSWSKNTRSSSRYYKPNDYQPAHVYYLLKDGKLIPIEKEKSEYIKSIINKAGSEKK